MKLFLIIFLGLVFFISCDNKDPAVHNSHANDATKTEPYYPISDYIHGQIQYVDSTPLAIYKFTFENGKQVDSTVIDRPTFNKLAVEFEQPDLNLNNIKPLYTESMYNDLSMHTITFTYDAKNAEQELRQATALLNPETKKVKNIIFKKIRVNGDTTITINGLWKNNMNFQLNYIFEPKGKPAIEKQIKVIWDEPNINGY